MAVHRPGFSACERSRIPHRRFAVESRQSSARIGAERSGVSAHSRMDLPKWRVGQMTASRRMYLRYCRRSVAMWINGACVSRGSATAGPFRQAGTGSDGIDRADSSALAAEVLLGCSVELSRKRYCIAPRRGWLVGDFRVAMQASSVEGSAGRVI
jgi:hypothetical protein